MRVKRVLQFKKIPISPEPFQVPFGVDVHILSAHMSPVNDAVVLVLNSPAQPSPLSRTVWIVAENNEIPPSAVDAEFISSIQAPGDIDNAPMVAAVFVETQDQALARASASRR